MIKLKDLLSEEETFTATNKETGKTSVFKSKDARDAAVKAGTHSKGDEKGGGDEPKGEKKPNMFSKDTGYDAGGEKSKPQATVHPLLQNASKHDLDDMSKPFTVKVYKPGSDTYTMREFDFETIEDAQKYAEKTGGKLSKKAQEKGRFGKTVSYLKDIPSEELPKSEPKKDEKKEIDSLAKSDDFDKKVDSLKNKISDEDYDEIKSEIEYLKQQEFRLKDFQDEVEYFRKKGDEDGAEARLKAANRTQDLVNGIKQDAKDLIKQAMGINEVKSIKLKNLLPENLINEGTRSQIGYIDRSGNIISTYVHWDGYPDWVGKIAKNHYGGGKVKKLLAIDKGVGISSLNKKMDGGGDHSFDNPAKDQTVFYGRDRGEKGGKFMKGKFDKADKYIKDAGNQMSAEYVYLYNEKDGKWYYSKTFGSDLGLKLL